MLLDIEKSPFSYINHLPLRFLPLVPQNTHVDLFENINQNFWILRVEAQIAVHGCDVHANRVSIRNQSALHQKKKTETIAKRDIDLRVLIYSHFNSQFPQKRNQFLFSKSAQNRSESRLVNEAESRNQYLD